MAGTEQPCGAPGWSSRALSSGWTWDSPISWPPFHCKVPRSLAQDSLTEREIMINIYAALAPAPAPFHWPQNWRNFIEKNMVAEEVFVNWYNYDPITNVLKGHFQGTVSYKIIRSQSRRSDLQLRGAGAERNIFGLHNTGTQLMLIFCLQAPRSAGWEHSQGTGGSASFLRTPQ